MLDATRPLDFVSQEKRGSGSLIHRWLGGSELQVRYGAVCVGHDVSELVNFHLPSTSRKWRQYRFP